MIYKFCAREKNSGREIQIQIEGVAGEPIKEFRKVLLKLFANKGIRRRDMRFIGTIATDPQGIAVPNSEPRSDVEGEAG